MTRPKIAITMGDPAGVGPELALWALNDGEVLAACDPVVVGSADLLCLVSERTGISMPANRDSILDLGNIDAGAVIPGGVNAACGRAAYEYIETAAVMAIEKHVKAITTAPINKDSLNKGGINQPGHTEILAGLTGAADFAMMQYSEKITVSFVTTHVALSNVADTLTSDGIHRVAELTAEFMSRARGHEPVIGVCALNPHSGEGGLFGNEESSVIVPAIKRLKVEGINAEGPLVPDAAFIEQSRKRYDAFIAMYHDQGHIPFKMLSFFDGVNVTLGLPIIRTSVDHGTAFDIAWRGEVDPGSMRAAILLASKLAGNK